MDFPVSARRSAPPSAVTITGAGGNVVLELFAAVRRLKSELKLFFHPRRRKSEHIVTRDAHLQAGLHLHTSNRLETLAAALANTTREPLSSPFLPEIIVVQSQGMARWLKQRLAEHLGVCANISFRFPNEMASQLFLAMSPDLPAKPPFERDVMLWLVMKRLPALLDKPGFEAPRNYLAEFADLRRRHQLAGKIAYLFDQYFVFRPDLVRAWDRGEDRKWQAELWRSIRSEIPHRHPAELQEKFTRILQQPNLDPSPLPERLCVFGISALPQFHLDLFTALGAHIPVSLFVVQPTRFYWGDIVSGREEQRLLKRHGREPAAAADLHLEQGNCLLASFGGLGRDFLKMIYTAGSWQEHQDFTEPQANTLLTHIQSDILNLQDRGREGWQNPKEETVIQANRHAGEVQLSLPELWEQPDVLAQPSPKGVYSKDGSIQIHSCHSPLREMEVLYDHMLDWFNRDPHLAPRDVAVMMPDLETYAPFVEAVFGSSEDESGRIPYRIADRGSRQASQVVQTFLAILKLPETRLETAAVLAVLENRAVREHFDLSEIDLELVRRWVIETRIRWGAGPEHRARLDLPALAANTWRQGFDRLLLGYAMAGRGKDMFEGIAPYDHIEGDSAVVLGRLTEFIERLFETVADLGEPRPLDQWAARLHQVLDDFFQSNEEYEQDLQTIRATLHHLRHQHAFSQFAERIDLCVVLQQLTPELEEDRHGAGFLSGGVTFCALKPLRSIPFKIICLAGMNDSVFPRPNAHLSFDLMARSPRLGDRSTRSDDRYLFLETILSVRERLYISYVGQSIRDNSAIPPSVVVSELLDYVEQGFALPRDQLVTHHRLQAFHEAYFQPGEGLFSFSADNCRASQSARERETVRPPFLKTPLDEPESEYQHLTLDELIMFFCNPAAALLQRRLKVRLRRVDDRLEDREPFDLGAKESYPIKQQLLEEKLAGITMQQTLARVGATGVLPLGHVGEACSQSLSSAVESFWQRLQSFEPQCTGTPLEVDLTLGEFRLTGRLATRACGGILSYRAASIKAHDILRLWIQHLVANASGRHGQSILVGVNATHHYQSCQFAAAELTALLQVYWQGLRTPLKFFPRSSLAFVKAEHQLAINPKARTNPLAHARAQWEGNAFQSVPGERDDSSFSLCFGDTMPLDDDFASLARRIIGPILQHEEVKEA
jgi:exodeoxyribonuclease V gamma subunit